MTNKKVVGSLAAEEVSLDLDCFSNMFASCDAVSSSNNQI
jgi:hypothetical protein